MTHYRIYHFDNGLTALKSEQRNISYWKFTRQPISKSSK